MPPPLHGLRALDLTDALGHLCGRLLVDLGVEVIALRLEATPGRLRRAAPTLGEHTALVLRDVLGMEEAEIARLVEEKVAW